MKSRLLIVYILITLVFNGLHAQDYSNLTGIVLKERSDYIKNEELVLECSNYLLNSPVEVLNTDMNRLKALKFVMRWMDGTPDYTFGVDKSVTEITRTNYALLGVYMASMAKFVLENKDKSGDQNEIKYNSFLTLIRYCEDPSKNVKQNRAIRLLIKARDDNNLRAYLKMEI